MDISFIILMWHPFKFFEPNFMYVTKAQWLFHVTPGAHFKMFLFNEERKKELENCDK